MGEILSASTDRHIVNKKNIRAIIVIAALIAYPVVSIPLHKIVGSKVLALGMLPVIAAGCLLGLRSLLATALCAGLLSMGIGLSFGTETSAILRDASLGLAIGLAVGAATYLWRARRREADERRKAEDRAAQLAAVVESSESAVINISREGTIVGWNSGAGKIYGYTGDEARGRPASLLFPPGRPGGMSLILDAMEGGVAVDSHETVCSRKDGRLIDVSFAVLPVRDGLGRITGVSAMAREITEQKAEEVLRKRNAELSALFDISSALNETITIDTVLPRIVEAITNLGILYVERRGAIFVVEDDRMRLVCHMGTTDDFVYLHKDMKVGDCLCGLAAKTGEVIVSKNSLKDNRHSMNHRSIMYRKMVPHGHVIIPLKSKDRVAGVLCLYLTADVDVDDSLIRLLLSIGNQIALAIDNARLYEETRALSLHDPLTGLANRRLMEISLDNNFASAKRYERPFSVIMLDLDHFKKYNDTYGHVAGDRLLVDVAKMISREVRETDLAVRYGGEEFIIMLPETKLGRAYEVAERIRERVLAHGAITVSLGVSTYQQEMENKEDIIAMADDALYQAKQRGRNQTIALKQAKD
jgi:diguanylate cyclase (GGDEF)-like protein/PAS domain S-box-containing protein